MADAAFIRPACISDVEGIVTLVNDYAGHDLMLPLPWNKAYDRLRDFFVVELDGLLAGCGALHVMWHDLAEIRSVAVRREYAGKGIGRLIAEALLEDAARLRVHRTFMLVLPGGPMARLAESLGFEPVGRDDLPHKVWSDCLNCPKFADCDETAMAKVTAPEIEPPAVWKPATASFGQGANVGGAVGAR